MENIQLNRQKNNGRDLSSLGEFGLIRKISLAAGTARNAVTGIGDDCAVITGREGRDCLVSTDMLVEGTHFLLDDISPRELGWKTAAVNISDVAAMGGQPEATFLSLALPQHTSEAWIDAFIEGYMEVSGLYGAELLGGDTTCSPDRMVLNVTVLGSCPSGQAKLRSAARAGDLVCVTGTLGDSAAGLGLILERRNRNGTAGSDELSGPDSSLYGRLVRKHHMPSPRVREGLILGNNPGVHAMMDISDGIGSDLRHILEASGVDAEIDTGLLPLSDDLKRLCSLRPGLDAVELACSGGEDYELLFTVSPEAEPSIGVAHCVIGRITGRTGNGERSAVLTWKGSARDFLGFSHF